MDHQYPGNVILRELCEWIITRWIDLDTNETSGLRDEFETAVVKAIPSLQRMTTEVDSDGIFHFACETEDADGDTFRYGFSLSLFNNDPDESDEIDEDEEEEEEAA